tara:strand:- start:491 stop:739 length:249 start_codon:yes stop_codon:yes gene_type:complete
VNGVNINEKGKNMFKFIIGRNKNFVSNMQWYDIGLVKLSVFIITLLLAKHVTILLQAPWYWYALLFLVVVARPFYLAFKKAT